MKRKVCVFLGLDISMNLQSWKEKYKNDEVNDTLPYGYDRFSDDNFSIQYIGLNERERRIFFDNKALLRVYLYMFKLPMFMIKSDIIWTHYDKDALYISMLRKLPIISKYMCKQLSCFVWLIDNSKYYSKRKINYIKKLLNNIDKIIFLSYNELSKFKEIFKIDESKLEYVRFGINIKNYDVEKKRKVKPDYLNHDLTDYILGVGNDVHRDFETLIKVSQKNKDDRFIIATKKQLSGFSDNVIVNSTNLNGIRYLYSNCRCVVVPLNYNEHSSGCTTALEAAASKKPVIISDIPGIDDYVIDGKTGFIVPIGDVNKLQEAINKIKENPELAKKMGEEGYKYIKDKFDTKVWAERHIELSKKILDLDNV